MWLCLKTFHSCHYLLENSPKCLVCLQLISSLFTYSQTLFTIISFLLLCFNWSELQLMPIFTNINIFWFYLSDNWFKNLINFWSIFWLKVNIECQERNELRSDSIVLFPLLIKSESNDFRSQLLWNHQNFKPLKTNLWKQMNHKFWGFDKLGNETKNLCFFD